MELNGINALGAINNHKKLDEHQDAPKTAFINSAFGFGFNNGNSGDACAFQA